MPSSTFAPLFLVARFAEYYEQVAAIKLAIAEGRLGAYLTVGDETPPSEPIDLAARVSGRLAAVLKTQRADTARLQMPPALEEAHEKAIYVMAALTDEIFILETDWVGTDAWLDVLLEYRVCHSRIGGTEFFRMADELLGSRARDPLESDLAAVLLLALRLGFKGRYRGAGGEEALRTLRTRLFRLIERRYEDIDEGPAFPQAVGQLRDAETPKRMAPLTPWLVGMGVVLAVYLVVSSAIWIALMQPFRSFGGDG